MDEEHWIEAYGNTYNNITTTDNKSSQEREDDNSNKTDNDKEEDDDEHVNDVINFTNMFDDPDPYDTFDYNFCIPSSNSNRKDDDETAEKVIQIKLHGIKQENGQLLNSTGLTLWKASSLLCKYLIKNREFVQGKRVLELGAGLGLCGILAHHLTAKTVIMTDGDTDTLDSMRRNVSNNLKNDTTSSSISCQQLRWGKQYIPNFQQNLNHETKSKGTNSKFDIIIASDVIYVEDIIKDLLDTVMLLLDESLNNNSMFILAFVRRNVKIDLVLEYACSKECSLEWKCVRLDDDDVDVVRLSTEGIYVFSRTRK